MEQHDDAGVTPHGGWAMAAAVVIVAAVAAVTLVGEWNSGLDLTRNLLAVDVAIVLVGCAILSLAPRFPVATATVLGALGALSVGATPLAGTALLWLASQRRLPVAGAVGVVGVTAQVLRGLWRPIGMPSLWWVAFNLAIFAAVVGWGAMVRARRAVIASLRERARRAEAEQVRRVDDARRAERARIAREMHDVLAHRLSLLAAFAGALEYRPDAPPEQLSHAAGEIRASAHQALEELREVIGILRDDPTDAAAGAGTERPQPTMADLPRLVRESHDAGMSVLVDDGTADAGVPDAVGRTVYRVVQEALTNARKHASGQPVRITLSGAPGGHVVVDVRNPVGAPPQDRPATPGSGSGLIGLRERVDLAGGDLDHEITATGEFHLRVRLPWLA